MEMCANSFRLLSMKNIENHVSFSNHLMVIHWFLLVFFCFVFLPIRLCLLQEYSPTCGGFACNTSVFVLLGRIQNKRVMNWVRNRSILEVLAVWLPTAVGGTYFI